MLRMLPSKRRPGIEAAQEISHDNSIKQESVSSVVIHGFIERRQQQIKREQELGIEVESSKEPAKPSRSTRARVIGAVALAGIFIGAFGGPVWHKIESRLNVSVSKSRQDPLCWVVSSEKYPTATAIAKKIAAYSGDISINEVLGNARITFQTDAGNDLLNGHAPLNTQVGFADQDLCNGAAKAKDSDLDLHYES